MKASLAKCQATWFWVPSVLRIMYLLYYRESWNLFSGLLQCQGTIDGGNEYISTLPLQITNMAWHVRAERSLSARVRKTDFSHLKWPWLRKRPASKTWVHKRGSTVYSNLMAFSSESPKMEKNSWFLNLKLFHSIKSFFRFQETLDHLHQCVHWRTSSKNHDWDLLWGRHCPRHQGQRRKKPVTISQPAYSLRMDNLLVK